MRQTRGASTGPSNNGDLELLVATLEQSLKDEKTQRREEVETLQAQHKKQIGAANLEKVMLQKRIRKLLEKKSGRNRSMKLAKKVSLAAKESTQGKLDRVQEAHNEMLAESSPDHHVEQSYSELQQDNNQLCKLVAALASRDEESYATIQSTQETNQRLASESDELKERNKLVGRNLYRACQEAEYYREKMLQLNFVLEDEPGKYTDFDHEMKLRDKRFSDLELRAAECSTEMARVEKDRENAYAHVAELTKKLTEQNNNIAWLIESKSEFKAKSEAVFDMLSDRIVPSDLFTAMNEYFHLVIRDNVRLQQKVGDHSTDSFLDWDNARQLRIDNHNLEKQAMAHRETQAGLEDKIRTLESEIEHLEFKIEGVIDEHRCQIKDKDSVIAVLRAEKDDLAQDVDSLARETDPSSIANLVARKNLRIAELKTEVKNLEDEKYTLEQNERHLNAVGEFNAIANCYSERESEELKIRVRNMDEELRMLRRRVYE